MSEVRAIERNDSRRFSGDDTSIEYKWDVIRRGGTAVITPDEAFTAIAAVMPPSIATADVDLVPDWPPDLEPNKRWMIGTLKYVLEDPNQVKGPEDDEDEPDVNNVSFQIAGESLHVTQSRSTRGSYDSSGAITTDTKNVIGWDGKGNIQGTDIYAPVLSFNQPFYRPLGFVTRTYIKTARNLVGKTNNATIFEQTAGELLLLGLQGARNPAMRRWDLVASYLSSENLENIDIGPISVAVKKGWDYLDIKYTNVEDAAGKRLLPNPKRVDVRIVYESANQALLFGGP